MRHVLQHFKGFVMENEKIMLDNLEDTPYSKSAVETKVKEHCLQKSRGEIQSLIRKDRHTGSKAQGRSGGWVISLSHHPHPSLFHLNDDDDGDGERDIHSY